MDTNTFLGMLVVAAGTIGSLIAAIVKPLRENTKAMTENTEQIKNLNKAQESYEKHNHESHQRFWDHEKEQDHKIEDHELRINNLEHKKGGE